MSTPPTEPRTTIAQPPITLETQDKVEYDRLIAFFEKLVKWSLYAITAILALAAAFLWKSTSDVQNQAATAINATKESASREISDIGKKSAAIAQLEAQKAIDAAFEKQNIQQLIERTAQDKVNSAVEAEIQKNFSDRIRVFENEMSEIAGIASRVPEVENDDPLALHVIIKKLESPNPRVSAFARQVLRHLVEYYETRFQVFPVNPMGFIANDDLPKNLMVRINKPDTDPINMATAFHDLKKVTGWNVEMFDVPAANRWCTVNHCDQLTTRMR